MEVLFHIFMTLNPILNNAIFAMTAESFRGTVFLTDAGLEVIVLILIL